MPVDRFDAKPKNELDWSIGKKIVKDGKLYGDELKIALGYCQEAARAILNVSNRNDSENGTSAVNTVVGIVGERGSGKSSFLYTLKDKLPDECLALEVVDPSNFQSDMSALELFLAQVYNCYVGLSKKASGSASMCESSRMHALLRRISKSLSIARTNMSVYGSENPSMEVLGRMTDLLKIGEDLRSLCGELLAYANASDLQTHKKYIAMLVDDADMVDGSKVYELLEDVRKYLSGRIVVVMAYRDTQIKDSILEGKVREYQPLLERGLTTVNELQSQIEDFIEKVIPLDRTVRLFTQKDLLEARLLHVLGALGKDDNAIAEVLVDPYAERCGFDRNVTVREWIDSILYEKTLLRVIPIVAQEETVFVWPRNLRELISLAKVLEQDLSAVMGSATKTERFERYQRNLKLYRSYFIGRIYEAFDPVLYGIINRWQRARSATKNYVAYVELYNLVFGSDGVQPTTNQHVFGEFLDASLIRPENVTLGDVSSLVNAYVKASCGDEARIHLGYSLKVLYSMELLSYLLDMLVAYTSEKELYVSDSVSFYLDLINSCVIPPEPASSPLSYEILYLGSPEKWSNVYHKQNDCPMLSSEESHRVMALLGCTPTAIGRGVGAMKSRSRGATVFASARPKRGQMGDAALYQERYNRPIFTMSKNNPLHIDAGDNFPAASSPGQPNRYPVNITNVLAKEDYLFYALDRVAKGSNDEANSAYLFYSMFDLDIFGMMRMDDRSDPVTTYRNQVRRINAALVFPALKKLGNESMANIADDETLMRIDIPFERHLLARIHAPFVTSARYRLFGRKENSSLLGFDLIVAMFANAEEARMSLSVLNFAYPEVRHLISKGNKNDILNYANCLLDEVMQGSDSEYVAEIQRIIERLRRPNTKPSAQERQLLREVVREYPNRANIAYTKSSNG